jgi:hypothetical protein
MLLFLALFLKTSSIYLLKYGEVIESTFQFKMMRLCEQNFLFVSSIPPSLFRRIPLIFHFRFIMMA